MQPAPINTHTQVGTCTRPVPPILFSPCFCSNSDVFLVTELRITCPECGKPPPTDLILSRSLFPLVGSITFPNFPKVDSCADETGRKQSSADEDEDLVSPRPVETSH